jgi:rSAM/selenodomain-associated transferase 2
MDVSVVIPAVNEADCIGTAALSAWDAGAVEVIVVDGGSTDDTRRLAKRLDCQVLEGPPGRAVQQNLGAARATGDVLLFLHADNFLGKNAVRQIHQALQNERVQGGAFRQQIDAAGWLYRLLERGNAWRVRWQGIPYGDQAIFLRRDVFERLGGFPPVDLMEDFVLMRKLRKIAWPVLLPGPVCVSARRWKRYGVVRQTLRNWRLVTLYRCGVPPHWLAKRYTRHDEQRQAIDE